jgi:glyceraldehyde-3-phosphate dehydrogenase (NADP+)
MTSDDALSVLNSAKRAWNGGMGIWPQLSLKRRIEAIELFFDELVKTKTEDIIQVLMWDIGKNRNDAEAEFDRTVSFAQQVIQAIRSSANADLHGGWTVTGATNAFVRRAAIGIILCLGPFNYPINETYATLIPALLMGSGREKMPPLMKTGHIDGLAFIGGASAADALIKEPPNPHRLKIFLQLEGKNMAIFLSDIFHEKNEETLNRALDGTVAGTLSFNGQRCTALQIISVPKHHTQQFLAKFIAKVEALRVGLPWQTFENDRTYSQITPLPTEHRIAYMKKLIEDATNKGASIVNENVGKIIGGERSTLMIPAILFPVDKTMDLYHQEQFGPLVPIENARRRCISFSFSFWVLVCTLLDIMSWLSRFCSRDWLAKDSLRAAAPPLRRLRRLHVL